MVIKNEEIHYQLHRRLQQDGQVSTVLRNTLRVYGSVFLALLVLFCILRKRYRRVYNLRTWVEEIKSGLAEEQYGFISWAWKLWMIPDDEIMELCGMDALCYTRVLMMGMKMSVIGMINAIWLMPLYGTAANSNNQGSTDPVAQLSIANLPVGSLRLVGTVIATYAIFGYTMYLLLQELRWFTGVRHEFLAKTLPRNYAVYVRGIPDEYRSSAELLSFFRRCFSHDAVLEAHVALKIPNLAKKVDERAAVVAKLEHVINVEEIRKVKSKRSIQGVVRTTSDILTEKLVQLNQEIKEQIEAIEKTRDTKSYMVDLEDHAASLRARETEESLASEQSSLTGSVLSKRTFSVQTLDTRAGKDGEKPMSSVRLVHSVHGQYHDASAPTEEHQLDSSRRLLSDLTKPARLVAEHAKKASTSAKNVAASAAARLLGPDDGQAREAGFVVFSSLRTTQAALQMLHHPTPFQMQVLEAPNPEDIIWKNVGKTNTELQVGKMLSLGCTTWLCFFWTIPVTFVATLSTISGLEGKVPFLAKVLHKAPWLQPVLAQLAPLLLILLNSLLPVLLANFSTLEGPVSASIVEASVFVKESAFMIIQTFFVSAISGSILQEITKILNNPSQLVNLLANSLPTRSTFFLQYLLVQTFIGMSLELLRVTPVIIAAIRKRVGPNLTEKERNTTFFGLRPLGDPSEFGHADTFSSTILYFMVFFVYATIAPITSFLMGFCFAVLRSGYLHQFIYIYPPTPDSGGRLWMSFISLCVTCMLIGQITLVGLLALKKATVATPLMFPLIGFTFWFRFYIGQQHLKVTERLPSRDCLSADLKNKVHGGQDFSFIKGGYIQPELKDKEVFPENFTLDREIDHGDVKYMTPTHSEAEILDDEEMMNYENAGES